MQVYRFSAYDRSFVDAFEAGFDERATALTGVLTYQTIAYSTPKQPPNTTDKHIAVFMDGDWVIEPDYRGDMWFLGSVPCQIVSIGDPSELGFTKEPAVPPKISAAPAVYPFDESGVYLGKPIHKPLDGVATQAQNKVVWADVPNSTELAPPDLEAKEAAVWANDKWSIVPDHRGEIFYDENGTQVKITKVGLVDNDLFDAENYALLVELRAEEERKQAEVQRLATEVETKAKATITAYQARMTLSDEQLAQFETTLALPDNRRAKTAWEYETDYTRSSAPIAAMQALFKWSEEQAEVFFDAALRG
jgi:uncharacterized protein YrzB (UPF0473 family)